MLETCMMFMRIYRSRVQKGVKQVFGKCSISASVSLRLNLLPDFDHVLLIPLDRERVVQVKSSALLALGKK